MIQISHGVMDDYVSSLILCNYMMAQVFQEWRYLEVMGGKGLISNHSLRLIQSMERVVLDS